MKRAFRSRNLHKPGTGLCRVSCGPLTLWAASAVLDEIQIGMRWCARAGGTPEPSAVEVWSMGVYMRPYRVAARERAHPA